MMFPEIRFRGVHTSRMHINQQAIGVWLHQLQYPGRNQERSSRVSRYRSGCHTAGVPNRCDNHVNQQNNFTVQTAPFGSCWVFTYRHTNRFKISTENQASPYHPLLWINNKNHSNGPSLKETVDQYPPHPQRQKPHKQSSNIATFKVFSRSGLPMEKAPAEFENRRIRKHHQHLLWLFLPAPTCNIQECLNGMWIANIQVYYRDFIQDKNP